MHSKNIFCLPPINGQNIPIPRGETRSKLVENGMVAKMTFESTWNETQMSAEIYGLFHHLFEDENTRMFTFQYLRYLRGLSKITRGGGN
jgi:hypothetical protein